MNGTGTGTPFGPDNPIRVGYGVKLRDGFGIRRKVTAIDPSDDPDNPLVEATYYSSNGSMFDHTVIRPQSDFVQVD